MRARKFTYGDDRREIGRHAREGIEADRSFNIGRVDIDEVVRARTRDMFKRGAGEVAMRIKISWAAEPNC
jgi:hypothetical protein